MKTITYRINKAVEIIESNKIYAYKQNFPGTH
jgi:hypothetical protein